jgi:hypothetical protein
MDIVFQGRCDVCRKVGELEYNDVRSLGGYTFVCRRAPEPDHVVKADGRWRIIFRADDCRDKARNRDRTEKWERENPDPWLHVSPFVKLDNL